ncbi:hypothetical protein DSO57_1009909 [Entomophthora muscae]|uniref:Uncharacterized protein n=1 Tax=Entomophthora muscae TaxID=34485 RepID=A0ACC2U4X4_9FUNG|nr:hypothetical protein DSO57_1009909 [Entomophthora muscae]
MLLWIACLLSVAAESPLKVLVHFDFGTMSHINPLLEVGNALRARNHSVVYAAADHNEKYNKPFNFTFASLGTTLSSPDDGRSMMKELFKKRTRVNADIVFDVFPELISASYEAVYPQLTKVVEAEKPDVIMCDFFSPGCRDVAIMQGIPLVTGFQSIDGFGNDRVSFVSAALDYVPITTGSMSFFERLKDKVFVTLRAMYKVYPLTKAINKKRDQFNVPRASHPLGDFSSTLALANTFIGFEAAAPVGTNIRMIGPIRVKSAFTLTPDLLSFLDAHPRTIYIAFGTKVVLADFDIDNLLKGTLAALDAGVIDGVVWGLSSTTQEEFPKEISFNNTVISTQELFNSQHPDIRLLAWAPQDAILNHKNTRLFLSHGGLESAFEAIFSGTPILCMPFFSDQPRNARKLEDAGISQYVDRIAATPASVTRQITEMLEDVDGSISNNVRRMQILAQIGSRRKELGADAIEEYVYTARICRQSQKHRYGEIPCEAKHLVPADRDMSYITSSLMDVYFFAGILFALAVSLVTFFLSKFITYLFSQTKDITPKQKTQ